MRVGILGLLVMLLAFCQAKRTHSKDRYFRHRVHPSSSPSDEDEEDSANQLSRQDEHDECHRAALHKCGQTFLRAHKLLSYLDDDMVAFRTRCGVRTAFFECLKTTREKICSRPLKHHGTSRFESDFRKKLTDTLWSTRVCVLGVKSFANTRH